MHSSKCMIEKIRVLILSKYVRVMCFWCQSVPKFKIIFISQSFLYFIKPNKMLLFSLLLCVWVRTLVCLIVVLNVLLTVIYGKKLALGRRVCTKLCFNIFKIHCNKFKRNNTTYSLQLI